ncbi:DUF6069 family protein [Pseudonocardia sp. MH-G8]|uniref:DUF6069 family protein n=1 Tax=Pseudonocardia sp. MH-G8 TaxID=1854588 RepID=UPI000BA03C70|nr:DUF6069 family protein [Pseudonocardia sp. MH-G8]OZM79771.1 hypothetical protein CFP66_24750 [Pseudonocardia sp. MH-G8]
MPTTETTQPASTVSPRPSKARRPLLRLAGVGATVVVTLVVWAVGRLAGADYVLSDPSGSVIIDPVVTAVVTLVAALLGWGTLALLERLTRHAARIWVTTASIVVIASMVPIFLIDATPGTQVALFFVHLAVAVLVPALLRARNA